jgi:hemoglobin
MGEAKRLVWRVAVRSPQREEDPVTGSVFERLGGFARVRLMVSAFYDKVLASEDLGKHFQHVDMRRLIDHQTKFTSAIMGGPASFTDEQIARAHQRLGISAAEFDEMADLFRETLEDFDLPPADVNRLHAHVVAMRDHVIGDSHVPTH